MFELLVASGWRAGRPLGESLLSLGLHAVVIFGAVEASRNVARAASDRPADTTMLFLLRPDPDPPPPKPPEVSAPPPAAVIVATPPPKGFQTVVAPEDMPTAIPPVDLSQPALDPRNFTGKGVEGGIADGVIGGTGPVDAPVTVTAAVSAVFTAAELDEPAQVIHQPEPRFPPVLQAAGVEGAVQLEFVIGTTGKVENRSVTVILGTDSAFAEPAREAILGSTFRPARMQGRAVRQLARQTVRFTLVRR
ncbi:MAG TPA: energy transducer TonB [Gemmatimonadales bacterium]|nr:energy transducer TonB [Gemmatimonadales bacterium]